MINYNQIIQNYLLKASNIYIIDIVNDKVISQNKEETKSYTSFLTNIINSLSKEDSDKIIECLSIQYLEQSTANGKDKINITINKNNSIFLVEISLIKYENNKLIIYQEKEITASTKEKQNSSIITNDLASNLIKIYSSITNTTSENKEPLKEYIKNIINNIITNYPEIKSKFNSEAINLFNNEKETILIIDDDKITRTILAQIFENKYQIEAAENGLVAINILKEKKPENISCIFLDLMMPVMDGFNVLNYLSNNNYLSKLPVIIISGDYSKETRNKVYSYPIADMLEKPFTPEVIKHRVNNLISLYKTSNSLNSIITEEKKDFKLIVNNIINAYLSNYQININKIQKYISIMLQDLYNNQKFNLDNEKITKIIEAIKYYDAGYMIVPNNFYNRSLTIDEQNIIRTYPIVGSIIVEAALEKTYDKTLINYAKNICKYYHETYDGTGYPESLRENNIPFEAQISGLIIAYHNKEKINESKFNPELLASFNRVKNSLDKVKEEKNV